MIIDQAASAMPGFVSVSDYLAGRFPDRCAHGWSPLQAELADCACHDAPVAPDAKPDAEWALFLDALAAAVRADGTIDRDAVRARTRRGIYHKHVGPMWSRARAEGYLTATTSRVPSTDHVGRNGDKLERVDLAGPRLRAAS